MFFIKKISSIILITIFVGLVIYLLQVFQVKALFCSPFAVVILILNSLFIVLFKKWLGSVGIFYSSITSLTVFIIMTTKALINNVTTGSFITVDLGRWVIINNLIDVNFVFCFDNLTLILSLMVAFLTMLAQFFGVEYMAREAFINRLVYLLNLFASSVILLFCVYDFILVVVAWELIGLFSFLLVNFYSARIYTFKSAIKTFIYSRISDLFIFITLILFILVFGTTDMSVLFYKVPFVMYHYVFIGNYAINAIFLITMNIALAGCIKGAQIFSHVWLPDAMEAPTPASALIHSSTLVIMGIYLIIRFGIFFEFSIWTNYFLILVGGLTVAYGAVVACFQTDMKKLVAYSTISQMGYLICGCGFCAYEETIIYLIMHACNKAFLFILVGYSVHYFNTNTDLRQMSSFYIYACDLTILYILIGFNLMGLPYGAGFYSKEFLLFQVSQDSFLSYYVRGMWFISFCFTPYYMLILVRSVNCFSGKTVKIILNSWNYNTSKFFIYKRIWNDFKKAWNDTTEKMKYANEFFQSPAWSLITAFTFLFVFILFNIIGEYFIYILYNFTSINQFTYNSTYSTLDIGKTLMLSLTPSAMLESLLYFVFMGLILAVRFLFLLIKISSKYVFRLLVIFEILMVLLTVLLLIIF
jgi:NADH:ubiquinone oxidoreductase subunit 5 (subunit L)/multisubunit Na+/H+ antiporter MnhA subunit